MLDLVRKGIRAFGRYKKTMITAGVMEDFEKNWRRIVVNRETWRKTMLPSSQFLLDLVKKEKKTVKYTLLIS